jgi:uncharacterized protein (TIGR02001 family)
MGNIRGVVAAAGAFALASAVLSASALADDSAERTFGYSITMSGTSDYVFRGISSNNEDPAFQPYVEFTYGIGYVGFWGSNVASPADPFELDIVAGLRPVTGPVNWDIGVIWYTYPESNIAGDLDFVEFKVGATVTPVTNLTLGLTGYVAPDQSNYPEAETIEGSASYALPKFHIFEPSISGLVGYTNADKRDFFLGKEKDYTYWNAGLKLTVEKYFMDFRYWDTSIDDGLADSRFVFSAGVTLP